MNNSELKHRTMDFALEIIKLVENIPASLTGNTIGKQLIRSGTSIAANYRSACRVRSNADFISKIAIVEEESDETLFWLELLSESKILPSEKLQDLIKEANELTAIFTASGRTAKKIINPKPEIRNPK